MNTHEIAQVINGVHFRPGWSIEGREVTDPTTGEPVVAIWIKVQTVNSDRDQALQGYPEKITIADVKVVRDGDFTSPEEIYAALLAWFIELEIHECREFFRVGKDMAAPFHPHRPEGQARWEFYAAPMTV